MPMKFRDDSNSSFAPEDRGEAARHAKCIRWFRIVVELERLGGCTVAELAQRHSKEEKTLRRDIEGLQEVGIPLIDEMVDGRKVWRLAYPDMRVKFAGLIDLSQWLMLRLAMDSPALRGSSSLFAAGEAVAEMMETALGKQVFAELRALDRCIVSLDKQAMLRASPDLLYPLLTATSHGKICEVVYKSPDADKISRFEILPLYVLTSHMNGLMYLRYWSAQHKSIGTLMLNRMIDLIPTDRVGERPSDQELQDFEDRAFNIYAGKMLVTIQLRFSKSAASRIREKQWHRSQVLKELPDGGVELIFTCGESPELTAWIASWLDAVSVMSPASIQQTLLRSALNQVKMYEAAVAAAK